MYLNIRMFSQSDSSIVVARTKEILHEHTI